jgi:glucosamine 6-phosphate synthetase-like amidotransferase/phosphosugar isomerase protein
MCGCFGFVSFDGRGPSLKHLEAIARVTMSCGKHAFGFAWLDGAGRLRMFKQTGKIVDHLGLLAMAKDARMLIGHCRFATHGDPGNNLHNHPHSADGGWIVHNGVIRDYDEIVDAQDLHPVTSCDSEVLGLLIEQGQGTLRERCVEAVQYASGSPLVMLGLWSRPGRMVALRSSNPLALGVCEGRVYLGSLPEGLPGKVLEVPDGGGADFTASGMKAIKFKRNAESLPF